MGSRGFLEPADFKRKNSKLWSSSEARRPRAAAARRGFIPTIDDRGGISRKSAYTV